MNGASSLVVPAAWPHVRRAGRKHPPILHHLPWFSSRKRPKRMF